MQQVAVIDEETLVDGRVSVVARFNTIEEAEAWIGGQSAVDPAKVVRGGYGIDAPEHMINP